MKKYALVLLLCILYTMPIKSGDVDKKSVTGDFSGYMCSNPRIASQLIAVKWIKWPGHGVQSVPVIIDTKKAQKVRQFEAVEAWGSSISPNREGTRLLSRMLTEHPFACVYDIETGKRLYDIGEKLQKSVWGERFSPDGKEVWFFTFLNDKGNEGILRYSVQDKKYIGYYTTKYDSVSPDSSRGVVLKNNTIEVRDIAQDKTIKNVPTDINPDRVGSFIISSDNARFMVLKKSSDNPFEGGFTQETLIGSLEDGTYKTIELPDNPSNGVFSPGSDYSAYVADKYTDEIKKHVYIYDKQGTIVKTLNMPSGGSIGSGESVWNKDYLATYLSNPDINKTDGTIEIWHNPLDAEQK